MIQELTTYVFYKKHKQLALSRGDEVLAAIYGLIARDEVAHFGFYAAVTRVLLEDDREGVKQRSRARVPQLHDAGVRPRARLRRAREVHAQRRHGSARVHRRGVVARAEGDRRDPHRARRSAAIRASAELARDQGARIAIVGMGCRFPQARDVGAYWRNITSCAASCFSEIPAERWNHELFYDPSPRAIDKTYARKVGLLDDVARLRRCTMGSRRCACR